MTQFLPVCDLHFTVMQCMELPFKTEKNCRHKTESIYKTLSHCRNCIFFQKNAYFFVKAHIFLRENSLKFERKASHYCGTYTEWNHAVGDAYGRKYLPATKALCVNSLLQKSRKLIYGYDRYIAVCNLCQVPPERPQVVVSRTTSVKYHVVSSNFFCTKTGRLRGSPYIKGTYTHNSKRYFSFSITHKGMASFLSLLKKGQFIFKLKKFKTAKNLWVKIPNKVSNAPDFCTTFSDF